MKLLTEIRQCTICSAYLPKGPKPIIQASSSSKILIIGQAPGQKAHDSGIPWNDPSGDRLRLWLGVTKEQFYDPKIFALMPMGFCYPGRSGSGDAPPRPECAPKWHTLLMKKMPQITLTLLVGQYAQRYYLKENIKDTLTDTVLAFGEYLLAYIPMPHPSPRNQAWFKYNPWLEKDLLPKLRNKIGEIIHK
ncbi:MAG: uracil-DNA glycosylase [Bacteroidetes bacterium]|nr:uracil-DNA glycosylase [Bacteroidota bacterium]